MFAQVVPVSTHGVDEEHRTTVPILGVTIDNVRYNALKGCMSFCCAESAALLLSRGRDHPVFIRPLWLHTSSPVVGLEVRTRMGRTSTRLATSLTQRILVP